MMLDMNVFVTGKSEPLLKEPPIKGPGTVDLSIKNQLCSPYKKMINDTTISLLKQATSV